HLRREPHRLCHSAQGELLERFSWHNLLCSFTFVGGGPSNARTRFALDALPSLRFSLRGNATPVRTAFIRTNSSAFQRSLFQIRLQNRPPHAILKVHRFQNGNDTPSGSYLLILHSF